MIASLADPPQGDMYKPMTGDLFPKNYPPTEEEMTQFGSYFFRKYYLTQRLYMSFAKRP